MNIVNATKGYEAWLGARTTLVPADLKFKHRAMRESSFPFFRATYYRWAQLWPDVCPELVDSPKVLAVGDLHVENFGTWRDIDGRLVWGINDFDECHPLPFTNDLVRLTVSAHLAIAAGEMGIPSEDAAAAILAGYRACLKAGGRPLVLVDSSTPLRVMARHRLEVPERFWQKITSHPVERRSIPKKAKRAIEELLPDADVPLNFLHRVAGLGSLGKQRFTAIGTWLGGQIAREAKALTASACRWAEGRKGGDKIHYDKLLRRAVRCRDPLVVVRGEWLGRRLSPDCFRIPLSHLPKKRDERELLFSMGWETANIHLGSAGASTLAKHLQRKPGNWLHQAAGAMREQTVRDWKDWARLA